MDITRQYFRRFISEAEETSIDKPPYNPTVSAEQVRIWSSYGDIAAEFDTTNGYTITLMCQTPAATGEKENWYVVLVTAEDNEDLTPEIPEAGPDGHTLEDALNVLYRILGPKNKTFAQKIAERLEEKVRKGVNESVSYTVTDFHGNKVKSGATADEVISFAKEYQEDPNVPSEYKMNINNIEDAIEYCDAAGFKVTKNTSEAKEDVDKIYNFNSKMTQSDSKEMVKSLKKQIKDDEEKIAKKPNKSAEKRIARNKDFIKAHQKFQKSGKEHPFDESAKSEGEDFYHYSYANNYTDPDKIKELIAQIRQDIGVEKAGDNNKYLIQELRQDLQKARALLATAKKNKDEAQRDGNTINFDTLGGNVQVYFHDRGDSTDVGFNSSSRGSIHFFGPAIEDYRQQTEIEGKILDFMEQLVSDFDTKVDAYMKELGFERR